MVLTGGGVGGGVVVSGGVTKADPGADPRGRSQCKSLSRCSDP